MFQIDKRPIVILSAPRTGSTALMAYIRKISNDPTIKMFSEPDHPDGGRMNEFLKLYANSKNFVLKTHLLSLQRYSSEMSNFFTTSDSVFRIRIQRRDLIKQIASYYIAAQRKNKWHFRSLEETKHIDTLDIDKNALEQGIQHILNANKAIKESQLSYDLDLIYEDLPKMEGLTFYITPKPTNYQEILDAVFELVSRTGIEPV